MNLFVFELNNWLIEIAYVGEGWVPAVRECRECSLSSRLSLAPLPTFADAVAMAVGEVFRQSVECVVVNTLCDELESGGKTDRLSMAEGDALRELLDQTITEFFSSKESLNLRRFWA